MEIFEEIKALKAFLGTRKDKHLSIGLVPTMGALHDGHLELIKTSKAENQVTVCSIYVNPAQFNNPTDLQKYPRTIERDSELLQKVGCDVIFAPNNQEMYAQKSTLHFDFGSLDKVMEGKFRPGHFSGVALVVSKLFNIVQPNRAYFGQKDFQQYKIISKVVDELLFDLKLSSVPIVREPSGLAMSSRNQRLNAEEKTMATIFYQSLIRAKYLLLNGDSIEKVRNEIEKKCGSIPGVRLEYLELADTENLNPTEIVSNKSILLIAGYVGEVRLIDNLLFGND
jgi:pantoate--beta-alanine ligase